MPTDWRREVTKPAEVAVFSALADPRWDFRTIRGLISSTRLPSEEIKRTIARYPSYIRRSPVPGPDGQDLYTLRMETTPREALSFARGAVSKTVSDEPGHGSR